ncbi:MAG: 30S ribosomal protein S21 [Dehalococcoidia bacterium]|nr:30S ribosomal protein S21 [Dehalococcoidia bacterium]
MSYVIPNEGEGIESLLRRFKVVVARSGVLRDLKDHRFFRSKAEKARVASQRAARRNRRKTVTR